MLGHPCPHLAAVGRLVNREPMDAEILTNRFANIRLVIDHQQMCLFAHAAPRKRHAADICVPGNWQINAHKLWIHGSVTIMRCNDAHP